MQQGLSGWHWSIRASGLGHLAYVRCSCQPHSILAHATEIHRLIYTLNAPTCSRLPSDQLLWTMAPISTHPAHRLLCIYLPCFPRHLWGQLGFKGKSSFKFLKPVSPSCFPLSPGLLEITKANPGLKCILPPCPVYPPLCIPLSFWGGQDGTQTTVATDPERRPASRGS